MFSNRFRSLQRKKKGTQGVGTTHAICKSFFSSDYKLIFYVYLFILRNFYDRPGKILMLLNSTVAIFAETFKRCDVFESYWRHMEIAGAFFWLIWIEGTKTNT